MKLITTILFCSITLTFCKPEKNTIPQTNPVIQVPPPASSANAYLALGDSYTIGTAVATVEKFPVQTFNLLKTAGVEIDGPTIIAQSGWATTDLINRLNIANLTQKYKVVSLLIGVNNQYQRRNINNYRNEFTQLLEKAIELASGNNKNVFVLSIPDYSVTPYVTNTDKKRVAAEIDAFNEVNKNVTESYGAVYLNVTGDSRLAAADASFVAADGLHFSGKMYKIWSEKLAALMKPVLQ
jgi:lysophospholipase L1-like esterase